MFLVNPIGDLDASIAKMTELKTNDPQVYFMGVFLTANPDFTKLPFDQYYNITVAPDIAATDTVNAIFNFICSVSPTSFL